MRDSELDQFHDFVLYYLRFVLIGVTYPVWIIPYLVYRKLKRATPT